MDTVSTWKKKEKEKKSDRVGLIEGIQLTKDVMNEFIEQLIVKLLAIINYLHVALSHLSGRA